ncbi:type II toxin-antitoxin system death-on-curing family toxin [Nesterenkonia sp.]|uniref:type II toxin-antitoxin system death-on-curing family toxin n=1 Tax=Nesterenkonia sp. TaxID=704201 RepID=UPI0026190844|nr:type II toxin-antitoxin system death-on-curing family toxin [Nesterenkonia sp.]
MQRITLAQALGVIDRLGFYVRDEGLLESALARPAASVFGRPAYASLPLAAAAQTESLARNHPLLDGNKRTAFFLLNVFLSLNDARLEASDDELFTYIVDVARGTLDLDGSAEFLRGHLTAW